MVFLADSILALSPPDIIHLMPPHIRKKSATRTETINNMVTIFWTTVGKLAEVRLQTFPNCPGGHGVILTANTGIADVNEATSAVVTAINFFIQCIS